MRDVLVITAALAGTLLPAPAWAQDLPTRLDLIRDGPVRLSVATRPEICGDGRFIGEERPDGFVMYTLWNQGYSIQSFDFFRPTCRRGPLRLVVVKADGAVIGLRAGVAVEWLPDLDAPDLGLVPGAEVAGWLLDVAPVVPGDVATVAFLAANATDAPIVDRLIAMATDRDIGDDIRQRAMRWMNAAARREEKTAAADFAFRTVAAAEDEHANVRERAIRELRSTPANDVFLTELYRRIGRQALQERILRRLGEHPTERNREWIHGIVLDAQQPRALRDRALRTLGDEAGGRDAVRALYGQLDDPALKERALRIVAGQGEKETIEWLQAVAMDRREAANVRERAIRVIADEGTAETMGWLREMVLDRNEILALRDRALRELAERDPDAMREVFGRLESIRLRDRALRLGAARGNATTAQWLYEVATDDAEATELRDRALRLLAERAIATTQLAALYDRMRGEALKQRMIRILAGRQDEAAVEKLIAIAEHDPNTDIRRYALRRLAQTGHPKARAFLEETVRRP